MAKCPWVVLVTGTCIKVFRLIACIAERFHPAAGQTSQRLILHRPTLYWQSSSLRRITWCPWRNHVLQPQWIDGTHRLRWVGEGPRPAVSDGRQEVLHQPAHTHKSKCPPMQPTRGILIFVPTLFFSATSPSHKPHTFRTHLTHCNGTVDFLLDQ